MYDQLRLMCVLAHPDDETLGAGGILARYAAEGVHTSLVTATRGQRGWFGDPDDYPGPEELGRTREGELYAAAKVLEIKDVQLLDAMDGELDRAEPNEIIPQIADQIRRVRPQVVITFDPFGVYGHPDHIAISQFTTAAIVAAASGGSTVSTQGEDEPHQVSKLYCFAETAANMTVYEEAFGDLVMCIDNVERRVAGWPEWAVTTHIDTAQYYGQVWQAVYCHRTQFPGYQALLDMPEERCQDFFSSMNLYRMFSLVNGGREPESDIFEGLW